MIATNTINVVCMVSILVGQTTLLISVRESKTTLSVCFPSTVVAATKSPKPETIITPITRYKKGSSAKAEFP